MGEWKKLTADEYQQILDYHRTWNIIWKKTGKNRKQETPVKDEMNRQIKELQENIDYNKKHLKYLTDGNESKKNPVEPSYSINGGRLRNKRSEINELQGEVARNHYPQC